MDLWDILRIVVIVVATAWLIWHRWGRAKSDERREKREAEEAKKERKAQRDAARKAEAERAEADRRRAATILRQDLESLEQKRQRVGEEEIWYLEGGVGGEAGKILLLHGFAGRKEDWAAVGEELVGGGLHVVAPDLPGFGQNPRLARRHDLKSQTKRLLAFTRALGLGETHVAGVSMGAAIAGLYAYSRSDEVRSLTLVEPLGIQVPYETELDQMLQRGVHPLTLVSSDAFDNLQSFLFHRAPELSAAMRKLRADEAVRHREFERKVWTEISKGEGAKLLELILPELSVPTLLLHGAESRVVHPAAAQVAKGMVKDARVATVEECGHLVMAERPRVTARHVLELILGAQ